jgi:SAM-dependent methyltransferase
VKRKRQRDLLGDAAPDPGWDPRESDVDEAFDRVYPASVNYRSYVHWTPVDVARRAALLLVTGEGTRVLDVGAGAGKFCIVGALATRGRFYGVEQVPHLVEAARNAADRYGVGRRAHFVVGDIRSVDWRDFDAFYLYNPFCEYLGRMSSRADHAISVAPGVRRELIEFTTTQLANAATGTRVATYHGFGGEMPRAYRRVLREGYGADVIELWVKEPSESTLAIETEPT